MLRGNFHQQERFLFWRWRKMTLDFLFVGAAGSMVNIRKCCGLVETKSGPSAWLQCCMSCQVNDFISPRSPLWRTCCKGPCDIFRRHKSIARPGLCKTLRQCGTKFESAAYHPVRDALRKTGITNATLRVACILHIAAE